MRFVGCCYADLVVIAAVLCRNVHMYMYIIYMKYLLSFKKTSLPPSVVFVVRLCSPSASSWVASSLCPVPYQSSGFKSTFGSWLPDSRDADDSKYIK